jgi:hypothetical protein
LANDNDKGAEEPQEMREQSFKSSLRSLPKEEGKKERKKDEGLVLDDEWGSCSRAKSANRLGSLTSN